MARSSKVLFPIVLVLLGATVGCAGYNAIPTHSESDSLAGVIQLTNGFASAGEAHFSADMRWIVFRAMPSGETGYQIYVAKVQRDQNQITGIERPIRITPVNSRNGSGCFSPDGLSLIFASTAGKERPDDPTGMEIFRVDDWEGAVSMSDSSRGVNLAQHPLTDDNAANADCAYSPNGKWICFTSNRGGGQHVFAMHSDGSHVVQLTKSTGTDGEPCFSPDGKGLAYRSARGSDAKPQIFVADLKFDREGEITGIKTEHQLMDDDNDNKGPRWHPDGKHLVYATSLHGRDNYELYVMRRDGSQKTRITFTTGADILPAFSPDGQYLMWTSKRTKDHTTQVFLARFTFPENT